MFREKRKDAIDENGTEEGEKEKYFLNRSTLNQSMGGK